MIKALTCWMSVAALFWLLAAPAVILGGQSEDVIILQEGWKFRPGDDLACAQPGTNDASWKPIGVDKTWEEQGYDKLDGFAWYRLKVVIPSRLREKSTLKDGLRIFLGKVNNFDQTFLNGRLIGINGKSVSAETALDDSFTKAESSLWDKNRLYVLPFDDPRLLWDEENVIAVRVFDQGGEGGLYTANASLRPVRISDYLAADQAAQPFRFEPGRAEKTFTLKNTSDKHTLQGTFLIIIRNKLTGEEVGRQSAPLELIPQGSSEFTISLADQDQATVVRYEFAFSQVEERWVYQEECPYILTPKPGPAPKINGAPIVGARPNRPFLFTVPATGERPITFIADGLPPGLTLDGQSGIISGRVAERGEYTVALAAKNGRGEDRRLLTILISDRIALTPPLGWNSWNCWGLSVDSDKILAAARAFKDKGLLDHGWAYLNIDDGWEIKGDSLAAKRGPRGNILTNEKFADMKALGDRLHALGLKFGIYSSPGPLTCGGYTGSYKHEQNDADSWASWGIDYVKYDWCSYEKIAGDNSSRRELMKPYLLMRRCLDRVDRDIVFSLCQYGLGKVWEWGAEAGGNLWRTTGDITDTWESLRDIGFSQVENAAFAGPGHWNDPDMLVVGWVGWGPSLHPSRLTPDEQYTHLSLWCLLSAPLLIGCDLERLDAFTLNLLTNDEVLALDQDPLGRQAEPKIKSGDIQVWVKELVAGNKAVGIFNLGEESKTFRLNLKEIGFEGQVFVRDLWRQKDLGQFAGGFATRIPSHGVVLVKLSEGQENQSQPSLNR
ncbi:MAG: putative Ig domain-containing protein [Candidatus Aminicenantales bacterium]